MKQTISKYILQNILIYVGFLMLATYIWLRFLRERLPKDIPFNLSLLGFFILLYICIIYLYLIFITISKTTNNNYYLTKIIEIIFIPLKVFDNRFRNSGFIKNYHDFLLIKLKLFIKKNIFYETTTTRYILLVIYVIFELVPRTILLIAFIIDIFYFYKLYYVYKLLPIAFLLLFCKYIKYSLDYIINEYILRLNAMADGVLTNCYDVDDDPLFYKFYTIQDFIDRQVSEIVYAVPDEYTFYRFIPIKEQKFIDSDLAAYFKQIFQNMLFLQVFKDKYQFTETYFKLKNIKILIFLSYFISWSYILLLSSKNLDISWLNEYWTYFIDDNDPFS